MPAANDPSFASHVQTDTVPHALYITLVMGAHLYHNDRKLYSYCLQVFDGLGQGGKGAGKLGTVFIVAANAGKEPVLACTDRIKLVLMNRGRNANQQLGLLQGTLNRLSPRVRS